MDTELYRVEVEGGRDGDLLADQTRRRPSPNGATLSSVESVRLDLALKKELCARAAAEGKTASDFIRDALREYLSWYY